MLKSRLKRPNRPRLDIHCGLRNDSNIDSLLARGTLARMELINRKQISHIWFVLMTCQMNLDTANDKRGYAREILSVRDLRVNSNGDIRLCLSNMRTFKIEKSGAIISLS